MKKRLLGLIFPFFLIFLSSNVGHSGYFSQYDQDIFLHKNFFINKTGGVFVDIGAHDGIKFSNTYFFEKSLGWSGVCIEPIPSVFKRLKRNRSCICLNGCIADFTGSAKFLLVSGYSSYPLEMLSGLVDSYDPRHVERIKREIAAAGGSAEVIDVQCYRLNDILKEYSITHVDYMSIDTEGSEFEILQSIDFAQISVDVISVENNYNDDKARRLLESKGYRFVKKVGGDEVYKRIS